MMMRNHIKTIHQRLRRATLVLWGLRAANLILGSWGVAGSILLGAAWAVTSGWRGDEALWLLEGSVIVALVAPPIFMVWIGWQLRRRRAVAAFLETQDPQLNDALLTVLAAEDDDALGSPEVIEALQRRVSAQMERTHLSVWAPWRLMKRGGTMLFASLFAWLIAFGFHGAELAHVFKTVHESPEQITQRLAYAPLIGDLKLVITPPAYTQANPRFIEGGSGDFEALEGSVVTFEATLSRRGGNAQVWVQGQQRRDRGASADNEQNAERGKDPSKTQQDSQETSQRSVYPLEREGRIVRGSFEIRKSFKWSVSMTDLEGVEWREAAQRQVIARIDRPPQVSITQPLSGSRVDPQKDLKVTLKGKDDYGLSAASLLIALDSDMENPEELTLNGIQGKSWSGEDTIDLRVIEAQSGDRIALWAKVQDNRSLPVKDRGAQTSMSEVVYLEIDSPEWEHRKLLDEIREHLEVQIGALAGRLEVSYITPEADLDVAEALGRWISARQESQVARDQFDALLKRLADDEFTPREIYLAFAQKLMQLEDALAGESREMNGAVAETPQGLKNSKNTQVQSSRSSDQGSSRDSLQISLKVIETRSAPVEKAHEEIIILIEAMVARMALEEMSNLADELKTTRAKIRDLMKMYQEQPSEALKSRIRRELQRFRQKMKAMRELMAKLQKKMPKEFLNLDGMKSDEVTDSLEQSESQVSSIEKLLDEGKIDEALEELDKLSNSLEEMSQQLQQDMEELHQQTNPELERALSELMDSTRDLMKAQAEVQKDTEEQQRAIDEAMTEAMRAQEELIKELQEKAKRIDDLERDLELSRSGRYLERTREDVRKAVKDLQRSLEQVMLEEGLDAAERSAREFKSLKRFESRDYLGRDRATKKTPEMDEAIQLSDEVAEKIRGLKEELEEQAQLAQQDTAERQSRERAEREAQARADAQPQSGQGASQQEQMGQMDQTGQAGQSDPQGQGRESRSGREGRARSGGRSQRRGLMGSSPGERLAQRQSKISQGLERLRSRLQAKQEKIPSLHQVPTEPFDQAQQASREASEQLREHQPGRGVGGQQRVSESLKEVMQGLQQAKKPQRGKKPGQEQGEQPGSRQGQRGQNSTERVELPERGERGPDALRRDVLDAMKSKPARGYDDQVKAYYDSLVR